jgi:hypothetical protein
VVAHVDLSVAQTPADREYELRRPATLAIDLDGMTTASVQVHGRAVGRQDDGCGRPEGDQRRSRQADRHARQRERE